MLGGWPVIDKDWSEESFDLTTTLLKLRKSGYQHDLFAKINVAPHLFAYKYNVIYVRICNLSEWVHDFAFVFRSARPF